MNLRAAGVGFWPRLSIGLAVGLLALAGMALPPVRSLELMSLDWRFRVRGPVAPSGKVVLVVVDDRTIAKVGRWPLPREVLATAVDRLAAGGPKLVALTLLLSEAAPGLESDLRAALTEARDRADPDVARRIDAVLAAGDADARLAASIARANEVVLPYAFLPGGAGATTGMVPPWIAATAFPVITGMPREPQARAQALLAPAQGIAGAALSNGHTNLLLDTDGALRFDLPGVAFGDDVYPSLALETVRLFQSVPRADMAFRAGAAIDLGQRALPLDGDDRYLVAPLGPRGTLPVYSLGDVLDGRVGADALRGRIVVLGADAEGAGAHFRTAFGSGVSGVEHVGTVIENMLGDTGLVRTAPVRAAEIVGIPLLALGAAFAAGRRSLPVSLLAMVLLAAAWVGLALFLFLDARVWLLLVLPVLAVAVAGGTVEGLRILADQRRRRALERQRVNLSRYFAPTLVDRLAATDRAFAADRGLEAAVMFVDIIGFTAASEHLSAAAAMDLLRAFHARVETAVFAHLGMVDKYMGDGALAVFGVPDPTGTESADAVRAARRLIAELAAWNVERTAAGDAPVRIGIGLHLGPVLAGDIGGPRQVQYTVIGDTVNVASRLEHLTRECVAAVVASDALVEAARAQAEDRLLDGFEPLPARQVRGRAGELRLWRLPAAA
ncbi:MAG: adenylate/guanylate cyclase domain-containing protein [Geminicoccaceae bacterium]